MSFDEFDEPVIGMFYYVSYVPDLEYRTGFLNRDGIHVAYSANGGQVYFRRVKDDGARGNLRYDNPCIDSYVLVKF